MVRMTPNGNIYYVAGDTFVLTLANAIEDGVTIDFTNWSAKLKVFNNSGTIIEFTSPDHIDLGFGTIIIRKEAFEMADVRVGQYLYDLVMIRPDGTIETWLNNKKFIVE